MPPSCGNVQWCSSKIAHTWIWAEWCLKPVKTSLVWHLNIKLIFFNWFCAPKSENLGLRSCAPKKSNMRISPSPPQKMSVALYRTTDPLQAGAFFAKCRCVCSFVLNVYLFIFKCVKCVEHWFSLFVSFGMACEVCWTVILRCFSLFYSKKWSRWETEHSTMIPCHFQVLPKFKLT